ncbi:MAG: Holliday junction resolvase RuvX [Burkholderiaceae bacterium]
MGTPDLARKPSDHAVWLAFDFGERRIGLAIGNRLTGGARPLCVVAATPVATRFEKIASVISEWQPEQILVGLPVMPDGQAHPFAPRCQRFARQLEGRFGLPVTMADERYTSALAPGAMGDLGKDAEAAAILLQSYFYGPIDSA